jgi:D-psicose/D-tagatose/L-ribulose 3-epimerase
MVGGGQGAFIGGVHRAVAAIAGHWKQEAGAFSSVKEKALASAAEIGVERGYGSWPEMMAREVAQRADLGIEAVAIFTPSHMNAAPAIAAMGAGLGILYDTFHANIEAKDPLAAFRTAWSRGHINHFHISENDRGTPGVGHTKIRKTISVLSGVGYACWLTIGAFGKALPELAAGTRVWRDFFSNPEEVYTEGFRYIRDCWESE